MDEFFEFLKDYSRSVDNEMTYDQSGEDYRKGKMRAIDRIISEYEEINFTEHTLERSIAILHNYKDLPVHKVSKAIIEEWYHKTQIQWAKEGNTEKFADILRSYLVAYFERYPEEKEW